MNLALCLLLLTQLLESDPWSLTKRMKFLQFKRNISKNPIGNFLVVLLIQVDLKFNVGILKTYLNISFFTGENLQTAAQREVFEETGIKTEFVSLVAFRHYQPKGSNPRGKFGCSDIYFVAYLRPISETEIKMCTRELRNACWMPVSFLQT